MQNSQSDTDINVFFLAQQRKLFHLYMTEPTVSQSLFHVPSPICATEGGSVEEETQAKGEESESMRQRDSTLASNTLFS